MSILEVMANDHKGCDEDFVQAEKEVMNKNFDEARRLWDLFCVRTRRHFRQEEDVLFPAFEDRTGMSMGPTQVMRMEHQQILSLVTRMSDALNGQNDELFLDLSETMMILLQQHNAKEEQMLYRMCDQVLHDQSDAVIQAMQELH